MTRIEFHGHVIEHRGVAPFEARSASETKDDWPFWLVAGQDGVNWIRVEGRQGQTLFNPDDAKAIAAALNEAA